MTESVEVPVLTPKPTLPETAAERAWNAGNWREAFEDYHAQAERGDPFAQVRVGLMFYDGLGRAPDFQAAETWFRRAAEQGSAEARYHLGLLYSGERRGAPFDLDVAVAFLREAAPRSPEAAFKLGRWYWDGVGVPEDRAKARDLIKTSAVAGYSAAVDWVREHDNARW